MYEWKVTLLQTVVATADVTNNLGVAGETQTESPDLSDDMVGESGREVEVCIGGCISIPRGRC